MLKMLDRILPQDAHALLDNSVRQVEHLIVFGVLILVFEKTSNPVAFLFIALLIALFVISSLRAVVDAAMQSAGMDRYVGIIFRGSAEALGALLSAYLAVDLAHST